ncbi:MAG: hypothetical protein ARM1_0810 [Candidatus Micrarchaeota archaeon]|nr:MAG: hypothetical protein ARM1_0810 [Candidatus Micrarchaeota archaeon]
MEEHYNKGVHFNIPIVGQSEEFTSAGACGLMLLAYRERKYLKQDESKLKSLEYSIWQDAMKGSVIHGSRYGLAYALAKRGFNVKIITNIRNEGYERAIAVNNGINLLTLEAAFKEIKELALKSNIEEKIVKNITAETIKNIMREKMIPIVLVDLSKLHEDLEGMDPTPHWVIVKEFFENDFVINDPYLYNSLTLSKSMLNSILGINNDKAVIAVKDIKSR